MRILASHKAQDVVVLDVRGLCGFTDFFLICSGTSRRQVVALAQHLEEGLREVGVRPLGVEGLEEGNWILLDYNDLVVHLFLKPLRDFYDLEGLWVDASRLPVESLGSTPAPAAPPS